MQTVLGLIAGNGSLPLLLLEEAKKKGLRVSVCAIQGEADDILIRHADSHEWIKLGAMDRLVKFFKREGVSQTMMGGKITKTNLFRGEVRPDFEMVKILAKMKNHSDDSMLGGIAGYLKEKGMPLLETDSFLSEEALPQEGVLTKRKPTEAERHDIKFGWELAKGMGQLDVGQTVVVKNKAVLSVEAIEGTDETILRGGELGNGDVVVVKVSKPNQDRRFDIPTIGLTTLESLIKARAKALAFEAGQVIMLDRERFIDQANQYRMSVVSWEPVCNVTK
jgi:UDP-2,3-diacylglucosamine hydrolase